MVGWFRTHVPVRARRFEAFGLRITNARLLLVIVTLVLYIWYAQRGKLPHVKDVSRLSVRPYSAGLSESSNSANRPEINKQRAEGVREAFIHSWNGYKQFAWNHNELTPVSGGFSDNRAIWGVTAVDSLSTAILMEVPDVVDSILDYINLLDFSQTEMKVSVFSSTKTHIGGMLSAYDLLTGPKSHLARDQSKVSRLTQQAQALADNLTFAFETDSKLPQNFLLFKPKPKHLKFSSTDITAAGTLILEWTRLSDLVKNERYADLAVRAQNVIFNAFDATGKKCKDLYVGLMGKKIRLRTGKFEDFNGGYMSGSGSYYEYLIKMYIYSPDQYASYRDRWLQAVDSTLEYLISHPSSRPDLTFLASYDCKKLQFVTDHTAFFAAGNFILGGSVLRKQEYIDLGLRLVESQVAKHRSTVTGLAPERWAWLPEHCRERKSAKSKECRLPLGCSKQSKFYSKHGHCILDSASRIRPETLESLYYAYRVTRDPKYQDMSWEIFQAINTTARVPTGGFSEIADVNVVPDANGPKGRVDVMYSWVMGETLKYAWMIHAEDDAEWHTDQHGKNRWVLNTQAHPIKAR